MLQTVQTLKIKHFRAEILYRAKVPPFEPAREVLQPLVPETSKVKVKPESDVLQLCNIVKKEVLSLGKCKGVRNWNIKSNI